MPYTRSYIVRAYQDRASSGTLDLSLFCHPDVLNVKEGIKLSVYMGLEKLTVQQSWDRICELVVRSKPTRRVCELIGNVLHRMYHQAPGPNKPNESEISDAAPVWKSHLTNDLFSPLMEYAILCKREHAEHFCWILNGLLAERTLLISRMITQISLPILWRRVNSPNDHVRMSAMSVQQAIYPPESEDSIVQTDCRIRHYEAMKAALNDDSVPIRVQALEGVPELMNIYYLEFPPETKKQIWEIMQTLAEDEVAEVRAAVFKGLRFFVSSNVHMLDVDQLLNKLMRFGIDDVSEKVRLMAFKLMNLVCEKTGKGYKGYLKDESVLNRLDFEQSTAVEREIVKLLHRNFFVNTDADLARIKRVHHMCRINQSAALDFHRYVYVCDFISVKEGLHHISNLLSFLVPRIKTLGEDDKEVEETAENETRENADETDSKDETRENADESKVNSKTSKDISMWKSLLDCTIVLYSTLQSALGEHATDQSIVEVRFGSIVNHVFSDLKHMPGLMDSAHAIVSLSPSLVKCAQSFMLPVESQIKSGMLDERAVHAFAMSDMSRMCDLIRNGLDQIVHTTTALCQPSPPKRPNFCKFLKEQTIIDTIISLLSATCGQYMMTEFDYMVDVFVKKLTIIRDNMMYALTSGSKSDLNMLLTCHETLCLLKLLRFTSESKGRGQINHDRVETGTNEGNPTPRRRKASASSSVKQRQRTNSSSNRNISALLSDVSMDDDSITGIGIQKDPLLTESQWLERQLGAEPTLCSNSQLLCSFYGTLGLLFRSFPHKQSVVQKALDLIQWIRESQESNNSTATCTQDFMSCRKHGQRALDFAEPDPLETITEEIEEHKENNSPLEILSPNK